MFHLDIFQDEHLWSPDADPEPIVEIHSGNQEEAQTFSIFDFYI